ncbi:UPF0481 protein At3g47200-like [Cornus florida]|uniref:UPF0481 protein At3g47200-like n=1 Tax=Cornus florida TaxID=4283 RepID=UPI00289EAD46|nr:UPF0481 protein At3g47200-like [Cornus florida]
MEHGVNIDGEAVAFLNEIHEEADPIEDFQSARGSDFSSVSSGVDHLEFLIHADQQLQNEIDGLPPLVSEPCIFKVNEGLRKGNEEAYTPVLVSIAPYHYENSNLRAMREHKLRYFQSLSQRINNYINDTISVAAYLILVNEMADRAKACYADPIRLERDEFVEMILLDACFIIEFLRKSCYEELRDEDDPIFRSSWMQKQICRDLMLLENQLPFFVLDELFNPTLNLTFEKFPLHVLAIFPIFDMLPKCYSPEKTIDQIIQKTSAHGREIKHFLDLLQIFYRPSFEEPSANLSDGERCTRMSTAMELQEAGISFKVDDDNDDVSIFDISFKNGQMKIPKFQVADGTDTFLRNIIAYEQHSCDVGPKYFTDYMHFMDLLINTEKDVNMLRLNEIIDNWLGDDVEVARLFNKLGDGVLISPSKFYYSDVCQKVKNHCENCWNRAKAKLRRNYFNNPWVGISTVAASILLLLTLIQTVVALIPPFS